jgi:hypothetical protein
MSKEKRFKVNMSFEDAMKKAATTKMNPAIQIDGKDKEMPISGVSGRWVEFVTLYVADEDIANYWFMFCLIPKGEKGKWYELPLDINPYRATIQAANIEKIQGNNPVFVPANCSLSVKVVSIPGIIAKEFKLCSLTYKVTD